MTESQGINYRVAGSVATLEIDRPGKRNALTTAMYQLLVDGMKAADADDSVKCIVIRSSSEHFCGGNDLADFVDNEFSTNSPVIQFLLELVACRKPLIAAVGGVAVGIGTTMLLHCDFVCAAENSIFSMPFSKLGLTPEGGSSVLLEKRVGTAKAREWLLSGRNINCSEALTSGLINAQLQDIEAVWGCAEEFASGLANLSLATLMDNKTVINGHERQSLKEVILREADMFAKRLESEEAKQAFNAFLKR